jgi:hypothetical protein
MRAFILGNGPSLKDVPLDLLIGETTFAMNRINLYWQITHPETRWRPTYYLAMDFTGPDMKADMTENIQEARHSFIRADRANEIEQKRRIFEWPCKIIYFWPLCAHIGLDYEGAVKDPVKYARLPRAWHLPGICGFGSTVHMAVQMAVVMEYNPIYLLGCDLGFREFNKGEPDPNHFAPNYIGYNDSPWSTRDATLNYTHCLIDQESRKMGVSVINLTPTGLDGIHKRMLLEEVL